MMRFAALCARIAAPPPRNAALARLEHALVLGLAAVAARRLWRLGPMGVVKAVSSALLASVASVAPAAAARAKRAALADIERGIARSMHGDGDADATTALPAAGRPAAAVLDAARRLKRTHDGFASGKQFGGVYHDPNGGLDELQADVFREYNASNPLYPTTFPALRKMEAECVAMVLDMVRGGGGACGLLTSGGTESVMIALLAYRERARRADPSRTVFEIVAASTAHACCHKACHYFGLTLVAVPPDPETLRLTPAAVAAKLTRHTVAIYASACTFTHGVVDDVPGLAALARARGLGLHVDNCFGGFLLSHLGERYAGPAWDLSVDGVSSLSCDVHKFGCASKGCSVVAFSDAALRRASYCPRFDGAEGLYVTPTLQGSRSGGVVAQAWATLLHVGRGGFEAKARGLADARDAVVDFVRERVPELRLLADHDATCPAVVPLGLAPGSPVASVYAVAHHMAARGWNLPTGQKPACVSVLLAYQHAGPLLDALLADLRAAVDAAVAAPDAKLDGELAVYGAADAIPDELLDEACRLYVDVRMAVRGADVGKAAAGP